MSAAGTHPTRNVDALATHVDALTLSLQALLVLLMRERDALCSRSDAVTLERVADEKHAAVERVGALYTMMRESLATLCGDGQPLADSVAALRDGHPALAEQVERLVSLTRECQHANQDNGVLVSAGLRSAHRAMDTLRKAQSGPEPVNTYGPAGQVATGASLGSLSLRA